MTKKEEYINEMIELGSAHELAVSDRERSAIKQEIDELYEKHWKEVRDDN